MSKKSFKDNPALQFISSVPPELESPTKTQQEVSTTPASKGFEQKATSPAISEPHHTTIPDRGPGFEAKSRRLNLLIRPSLFEKITKVAHKKGMSTNELIHRALEQALQSGNIDSI